MNAFSTIAADPVETAITKASEWVRVATPIIKAYLALDEIDGDMSSAAIDARGNRRWNAPVAYDERVIEEARGEVKDAREALYKIIEGIREDLICDSWLNEPAGPLGDTPEARDVYDARCDECEAFNDRLKVETISVDAALHQIGDY